MEYRCRRCGTHLGAAGQGAVVVRASRGYRNVGRADCLRYWRRKLGLRKLPFAALLPRHPRRSSTRSGPEWQFRDGRACFARAGAWHTDFLMKVAGDDPFRKPMLADLLHCMGPEM